MLPSTCSKVTLRQRPISNDRLSKGFNRSMTQGALKKWITAAGITKRITFHRFRDTFATLQLAAGTDIYTVSKMLDHANVTPTQIYAKLVDSTKRDTVNRIKLE